MVRRLVEHEQVGLARGETREGQTRTLAAREHADGAIHLVASEEEPGQQVACILVVEAARRAHRLEHRRAARQLGLRLLQIGDAHHRRGGDVALERREVAHERAHERGLARAVRANDRQARVAADPHRPAPHHRLVVAHLERRRLQDRLASEVARVQLPRVLRLVRRRLDALQARELLPAAARFLRALARAVPADEVLGARDLFRLPTSGGRLRGLPLGPLARVVRVAALVLDDGAVLDRQRPRGDLVEEPPVMTGYGGSHVPLHQERFQPLQRRDVEVVGGFIEQQHVRVVEQQPGQAEPRALSTGERRDGPVDELHQPKTREDAAQRCLEVVAAGVLEVVLQIGVALERLLIRVAETVFELAQLGLELAKMRGRGARVLVDRAGRVLQQLLLKEPDARATRVCDVAGVRLLEPRRHPQQRRLPRAVGSDEADAVALRDPEGDVLQELAVAEPAPDGLDRDEAHRSAHPAPQACPDRASFVLGRRPAGALTERDHAHRGELRPGLRNACARVAHELGMLAQRSLDGGLDPHTFSVSARAGSGCSGRSRGLRPPFARWPAHSAGTARRHGRRR